MHYWNRCLFSMWMFGGVMTSTIQCPNSDLYSADLSTLATTTEVNSAKAVNLFRTVSGKQSWGVCGSPNHTVRTRTTAYNLWTHNIWKGTHILPVLVQLRANPLYLEQERALFTWCELSLEHHILSETTGPGVQVSFSHNQALPCCNDVASEQRWQETFQTASSLAQTYRTGLGSSWNS